MFVLTTKNNAHYNMLSDLRQESLEWLLIPTAVASFYVVLYTTALLDVWSWANVIIAIGVVCVCLVAHRLKPRQLQLAIYVYILGLTTAVFFLIWLWFTLLSLVILPALILLSITLLNARSTLVIAGLASVVLWVSARQHSAPDSILIGLLAMVWLITIVAWISNRSQIKAIEWALSSYQQANKKTEEARQHRAELVRVHKALDEAYYRLERSNVQLARAHEEAENARRTKQQFVANVSHELRTPLNIIIGFSESMALSPESYGVKGIPRQVMGDINRIYRSGRHLKRLIDDVLDLSQIDAYQMPLLAEQTSLVEVIIDATNMIEGIVTRKGLTLVLDIPKSLPPVFLDRLRIRQVLLNLLSNAVRFTDTGGITVSVEQHSEELQVIVADTGPGIDPNDIETVFEEFHQLDLSLSKRYDGTGLGLALSRRFIELHGGRLWAESILNEGSRFCFTIPLNSSGKTGRRVQSNIVSIDPHIEARVGRTVLVATEEPMPANFLKRYLHEYQIKHVPQKELSQAVETYLPYAIIKNVASSLAGQAKDKVAAEQKDFSYGIPIISCPLPDPSYLSQVLGIDHYLVKPITRERLQQVLGSYGDSIKHILIVDDDAQLLELIARMVRGVSQEYVVDIACGGEEGVVRMQENQPDLVLLDLMMPMDGLTILQFMQADEKLQKTSVIMITAHDLPEADFRLPGQNSIMVEGATNLSLTEVLNCVQAILDTLPTPKPEFLPAPEPEATQ
jgi:signal transduction histidine kinase/CheY-like chemotaxis protein